MRGQSGQATVEWVGLLLVAAVVLGGLAALGALRAPAKDRELGRVLARRITCAAGAACPSGSAPSALAGAPGGSASAAPRGSASAGTPPVLRPLSRDARDKAVQAFRQLRGLGRLGNRVWIACLGYRRYVYERDHALQPYGTMPLREALETANTCLNPLNFVEEDG